MDVVLVPTICTSAREKFKDVQAQMKNLNNKVPLSDYYRFHDHWRFVIQRLGFLAALTIYLETEKLATREEMAAILGGKINFSVFTV